MGNYRCFLFSVRQNFEKAGPRATPMLYTIHFVTVSYRLFSSKRRLQLAFKLEFTSNYTVIRVGDQI